MSALEEKRRQVLNLIAEHGLEVWDQPTRLRVPSLHPNADVFEWNMRVGNPANSEDIFVDTLAGEFELWSAAEKEVKDYLANAQNP